MAKRKTEEIVEEVKPIEEPKPVKKRTLEEALKNYKRKPRRL